VLASRRPGVGPLLREWRQRRHLSQNDLALGSGLSPRHLSFVETGRSRPSPEVILHLAEHLDVPLRDRNSLLLAAGYAPRYRETPLDAPEMDTVRTTLDRLLAGHQPYPAVVVDRCWNLVAMNAAAGILTEGCAPELLAPPVNALRVCLHPGGMAPRILNLAEYGSHLLVRLRRQHAATGDPALRDLIDELSGYPTVDTAAADAHGNADRAADPATDVVLLLHYASSAGELSLFSTIATFGAPNDITTAELAIESFYPADAPTADILRARAETVTPAPAATPAAADTASPDAPAPGAASAAQATHHEPVHARSGSTHRRRQS
jgi:transcriptional regulator with XRE-family HTH domain